MACQGGNSENGEKRRLRIPGKLNFWTWSILVLVWEAGRLMHTLIKVGNPGRAVLGPMCAMQAKLGSEESAWRDKQG